MPSKSKTKGSGFERDMCKYLNELTKLNFMRVPSSGAYIGKSNQHRTAGMDDNQIRIMDGDIITPEEWKDWSLECKFYKDIAWKKMFQPEGIAQLNSWIEQSKVTSKPYWLLIFKINNAGAYCVLDKNTVREFKFKLPICVMHYQKDYVIVDMKLFLSKNHERFNK